VKGKILGYFVVGALTALDGFVIIDPGEAGSITRLGAVQTDDYMSEGIHFKWPFIEKVDRLNVQIKKFEAPDMEASSKDIQIVRTSCTVNTTTALAVHPC